MSYNPDSMVDRRALAISLQAMFNTAGFAFSNPVERAPDIEEIYVREVPQVPGAQITVFSSISRGATRPNGSDAIRVAITYNRKDGETKFLLSEVRVNRTGHVGKITSRTLERMRDAFVQFRDRCKDGKFCTKCSAPLFISRQGNEVCADTCWIKNAN